MSCTCDICIFRSNVEKVRSYVFQTESKLLNEIILLNSQAIEFDEDNFLASNIEDSIEAENNALALRYKVIEYNALIRKLKANLHFLEVMIEQLEANKNYNLALREFKLMQKYSKKAKLRAYIRRVEEITTPVKKLHRPEELCNESILSELSDLGDIEEEDETELDKPIIRVINNVMKDITKMIQNI